MKSLNTKKYSHTILASPDQKKLMVILLLLFASTLVFRITDWDIRITKMFYHSSQGWIYDKYWLWLLLYRHGMIPGILIGIFGLLGLFGWNMYKLRPYWRHSLLLFLLIIIGPGFLVNSIFKSHWGRPRPSQIIEFGGVLSHYKVWEFSRSGGHSFPSGHASIGFYTMAPYFVLRRRHRKLAWGFLITGTIYGLLMGLGRIAQGCHFPSDVIWAWGMVYLPGLMLYHLLKPDKDFMGQAANAIETKTDRLTIADSHARLGLFQK